MINYTVNKLYLIALYTIFVCKYVCMYYVLYVCMINYTVNKLYSIYNICMSVCMVPCRLVFHLLCRAAIFALRLLATAGDSFASMPDLLSYIHTYIHK